MTDEILKIPGFAEILVDRGKAHVGHGVQIGQGLHHQFTDGFGADLVLARTFQAALNTIHHPFDPFLVNRPFASGQLDRSDQFIPVKGHALPILFQNGQIPQLHPFKRREARPAIGAEPPPADCRIIFSRPGVLHLGVVMTAKWAPHKSLLSLSINWKSRAQAFDPGTHPGLDFAVIRRAIASQTIQDIGDQMANDLKFADGETPGRPRRRP